MPGEKFNVRLAPEDGGPAEAVVAEVGLEGFNLLSLSGRVLRKYPLHHISRWSMRGSSLILFAKSPVDVEDRTIVLSGDEYTIRSVLDTLTSSCMQMAELLQSGQRLPGATDAAAAASSLSSLLRKAKRPAMLTADQVEFWKDPEKAGWLHSQGEHIRTWRKRWFVLKQGFLFRFSGPDVTPQSRARGVVDLSTVTDVSDGNQTTGRPFSIRLATATGRICYLAESETAQVEWLSALEGAVGAIVRRVSGWEEEEEERRPAPAPKRDAGKALEETLHRSFEAASSSAGGPARRESANGRAAPGMIDVVNYQAAPEPAPRWGAPAPQAQYVNVDYGVDYGGIAGREPPRKYEAGGYGQAGGYGAAEPVASIPQGYNFQGQPGPAQPGTLLDHVTAPQVSQPPAQSPWQTHHAPDGRPYYYNVVTGITQWEAPMN
ncbi:hypothetical protein QBZ16_000328 [Prototheca wickerhamii]|uniref:PH domain-containing protein n=1 Tax=Prototheca wickerhamii TaxID=3111 RepID=A0AAD9MM03_PROWI|nr:hypothetical protein QBZ16_000328 [Prototheca wickerhamii]